MTRVLSIIGAASSAGTYAPGQEKAPAAFRRHGLIPALAQRSRRVRDRGDVAGFRWRPDPARPKATNLEAVQRTATELADYVADAMSAGEAVLVLGGDCTIELGTVAGALRDEDSVGLIYIDLDVDLNPPEASDGALDSGTMTLAISSGSSAASTPPSSGVSRAAHERALTEQENLNMPAVNPPLPSPSRPRDPDEGIVWSLREVGWARWAGRALIHAWSR